MLHFPHSHFSLANWKVGKTVNIFIKCASLVHVRTIFISAVYHGNIGSTFLFPSHLLLGSMGILPYDPNPQVILYDTWYVTSLSSFAEDEHIYHSYLFPWLSSICAEQILLYIFKNQIQMRFWRRSSMFCNSWLDRANLSIARISWIFVRIFIFGLLHVVSQDCLKGSVWTLL